MNTIYNPCPECESHVEACICETCGYCLDEPYMRYCDMCNCKVPERLMSEHNCREKEIGVTGEEVVERNTVINLFKCSSCMEEFPSVEHAQYHQDCGTHMKCLGCEGYISSLYVKNHHCHKRQTKNKHTKQYKPKYHQAIVPYGFEKPPARCLDCGLEADNTGHKCACLINVNGKTGLCVHCKEKLSTDIYKHACYKTDYIEVFCADCYTIMSKMRFRNHNCDYSDHETHCMACMGTVRVSELGSHSCNKGKPVNDIVVYCIKCYEEYRLHQYIEHYPLDHAVQQHHSPHNLRAHRLNLSDDGDRGYSGYEIYNTYGSRPISPIISSPGNSPDVSRMFHEDKHEIMCSVCYGVISFDYAEYHQCYIGMESHEIYVHCVKCGKRPQLNSYKIHKMTCK